MEIEINGKKVTPRFDIGMVKLFNKTTGKNFMKITEEEYTDVEVMSGLIFAATHRGDKSITMEDVDCLTFPDMLKIANGMKDMMKEFLPEATGEEVPLEENRQS
jgi:hypothetical protein